MTYETTMQCASCKHWKKDSDNAEWEAEKAGFGECLGVRARWRIMDEASEGMVKYPVETDEADETFINKRIGALHAAKAYVQDGSEYRAELFTAPDFFCALYTTRT